MCINSRTSFQDCLREAKDFYGCSFKNGSPARYSASLLIEKGSESTHFSQTGRTGLSYLLSSNWFHQRQEETPHNLLHDSVKRSALDAPLTLLELGTFGFSLQRSEFCKTKTMFVDHIFVPYTSIHNNW